MKVTFRNALVIGEIELSDELESFFLWLAAHRGDESARSLLVLLAEHDAERAAGERAKIRQTICEILRDQFPK